MKIYKLYENIHSDLVNVLQNVIIKDNKTINGFKFEYDSMNGVFGWSNGIYSFYATPYYDDSMILPINISNDDGYEIDFISFDLPTLKTEDQVNDIVEFYYERIENVAYLLKNRIKLKNSIKKILNVVDVIKVDRFIINDIDGNFVDTISDGIVDELLKLLNDKYSYILQTDKYNL